MQFSLEFEDTIQQACKAYVVAFQYKRLFDLYPNISGKPFKKLRVASLVGRDGITTDDFWRLARESYKISLLDVRNGIKQIDSEILDQGYQLVCNIANATNDDVMQYARLLVVWMEGDKDQFLLAKLSL